MRAPRTGIHVAKRAMQQEHAPLQEGGAAEASHRISAAALGAIGEGPAPERRKSKAERKAEQDAQPHGKGLRRNGTSTPRGGKKAKMKKQRDLKQVQLMAALQRAVGYGGSSNKPQLDASDGDSTLPASLKGMREATGVAVTDPRLSFFMSATTTAPILPSCCPSTTATATTTTTTTTTTAPFDSNLQLRMEPTAPFDSKPTAPFDSKHYQHQRSHLAASPAATNYGGYVFMPTEGHTWRHWPLPPPLSLLPPPLRKDNGFTFAESLLPPPPPLPKDNGFTDAEFKAALKSGSQPSRHELLGMSEWDVALSVESSIAKRHKGDDSSEGEPARSESPLLPFVLEREKDEVRLARNYMDEFVDKVSTGFAFDAACKTASARAEARLRFFGFDDTHSVLLARSPLSIRSLLATYAAATTPSLGTLRPGLQLSRIASTRAAAARFDEVDLRGHARLRRRVAIAVPLTQGRGWVVYGGVLQAKLAGRIDESEDDASDASGDDAIIRQGSACASLLTVVFDTILASGGSVWALNYNHHSVQAENGRCDVDPASPPPMVCLPGDSRSPPQTAALLGYLSGVSDGEDLHGDGVQGTARPRRIAAWAARAHVGTYDESRLHIESQTAQGSACKLALPPEAEIDLIYTADDDTHVLACETVDVYSGERRQAWASDESEEEEDPEYVILTSDLESVQSVDEAYEFDELTYNEPPIPEEDTITFDDIVDFNCPFDSDNDTIVWDTDEELALQAERAAKEREHQQRASAGAYTSASASFRPVPCAAA